jgi:hypothetical protein
MQELRLVNRAGLAEGKTTMEPVPQPRMPSKNQEGKALNGMVCNYELRKVKAGKRKENLRVISPLWEGVQIPPVHIVLELELALMHVKKMKEKLG